MLLAFRWQGCAFMCICALNASIPPFVPCPQGSTGMLFMREYPGVGHAGVLKGMTPWPSRMQLLRTRRSRSQFTKAAGHTVYTRDAIEAGAYFS